MTMKFVMARDLSDFGRKARVVFLESIMAVRSPNASPSVTLPTGNTPVPFYAELRKLRKMPAIAFRQLDEYIGLPENHPRLFLKELQKAVLGPLKIEIGLSFNGAADLPTEMQRVRSELRRLPAIDIAVVGVGQNGHVAFNEPGSDMDSDFRVVNLTRQTQIINAQSWDDRDGAVPTQAMTLGFRELREAKHTIVLVTGNHKANILARALTGPVIPDVPASYLQEQKNVIVVGDKAAFSRLPNSFDIR